MKKVHISRVILQFIFILLFISCKNKNNEIIIVKNLDNDLSTEIHFCKIHNQKMYEENRREIFYGLPIFEFWNNIYPEIREKYFPNSIEITFGGCLVYDKTYEISFSYYYVCNECNKERDKYFRRRGSIWGDTAN